MKTKSETLKFLERMNKTAKLAEELSDEELVDILLNEIWASMDMSTMHSAVLGEVMKRLADEDDVSFMTEIEIMAQGLDNAFH